MLMIVYSGEIFYFLRTYYKGMLQVIQVKLITY